MKEFVEALNAATKAMSEFTKTLQTAGITAKSLEDTAKTETDTTDDLFGDDVTAETKEVTIDAIRQQLKIFLDKNDAGAAKEKLAKFKATNLSGLKAEQYADFLKEIS